MTQRRMTVLAGAVFAAAFALLPMQSPALAADCTMAGAIFARLDANGDGRIVEGEIERVRAARFERLDLNGDGALSEEEITEVKERFVGLTELADTLLAMRLDRLDANGDGRLSRAEFLNRPASVVARLADADDDGAVSRAEFDRVAAAIRASRGLKN